MYGGTGNIGPKPFRQIRLSQLRQLQCAVTQGFAQPRKQRQHGEEPQARSVVITPVQHPRLHRKQTCSRICMGPAQHRMLRCMASKLCRLAATKRLIALAVRYSEDWP